ncbi:MAG: stage III sporulation protein AC [Clostridiales bacterium]|jgi:stage III sporulation protein AC|nr:stage III sporulation protein AC [Clostridiales bacterium]
MNIDVILKIAGVGILTAVINIVLKKSDKDEIATFTTLAGLIIVILMVIDMIGGLFDSVRSIFRLY